MKLLVDRLRAGLLAFLCTWAGAAHCADPMPPGLGPARHFDMKQIRDASTLATVVLADVVRDSAVRPGKRVRVIELRFTSQQWKGLDWQHPTRIYVPDGYAGGGGAGIIGTERRFFDTARGSYPRHTVPGTKLDTESEYAEATALDLGLPIMIFSNPAEDYWGMGESDLTGYTLKKALETEDPTWFGYYPIVKAYLRAITLMASIPGVQTERAVISGCSKRGFSVSIATGVDPDRIAGVMATCYYGGNTMYFIAKKFAEFGPGVGGPSVARAGPGYQPPDVLLRTLNSPFGLQLAAEFDPYMWRRHMKPAFMVALGTNDEFYALGSANSMLGEMSGDKAFLAVDNVQHSWVSGKHLAAWRMWLAHTLQGRVVPTVKATSKLDGPQLVVSAQVTSSSAPVAVRLFHASNRVGTDWRAARWQSVAMSLANGVYTGAVARREDQALAYYVEVEDQGRGGPGFVSSLVEIVTP